MKLKREMTGKAIYRSAEELMTELVSLPYVPFAPIRAQLCKLVRAINKAWSAAGFEQLGKLVFGDRRSRMIF